MGNPVVHFEVTGEDPEKLPRSQEAERLGGKRRLGPEVNVGAELAIGLSRTPRDI